MLLRPLRDVTKCPRLLCEYSHPCWPCLARRVSCTTGASIRGWALCGSTLTSFPCIPESSFTGKEEPLAKSPYKAYSSVWGIIIIYIFFLILFPLLSDSAAAAIVNDVLKMELLFSIGGKKPSLSWLPTGSTSHSEGSGWGGYLAVSSSSLMSKAWEFHKQIARQLHPTQVGDGRTNC